MKPCQDEAVLAAVCGEGRWEGAGLAVIPSMHGWREGAQDDCCRSASSQHASPRRDALTWPGPLLSRLAGSKL